MKKLLILINIVILVVIIAGCEKAGNSTKPQYEDYVVNSKLLRFYVIRILGTAPLCDDKLVGNDDNKNQNVILTGGDFSKGVGATIADGLKYCYAQEYFYLDLSLYEDNSYYLDDIKLEIDDYDVEMTFSIKKNFVYQKSSMLSDNYQDLQDGFHDRYGDNLNDAGTYYLQTTYLYKDFPLYYYDEEKYQNNDSDQLRFQNEELEMIYYHQREIGHNGYDGLIKLYQASNSFNELFYPTSMSFIDNGESYSFNNGVFYIVVDLRNKA